MPQKVEEGEKTAEPDPGVESSTTTGGPENDNKAEEKADNKAEEKADDTEQEQLEVLVSKLNLATSPNVASTDPTAAPSTEMLDRNGRGRFSLAGSSASASSSRPTPVPTNGASAAIRNIGRRSLLSNGRGDDSASQMSGTTQRYRKKNPLFFGEHRAKARSTSNMVLKTLVGQLKVTLKLQQHMHSPLVQIDQAMKYRSSLAKAMHDTAPEEEVQYSYLRSILRKSEVKQRQSLRNPRRATKERDRIDRERKLVEKRMRGILGRQPLPSHLDDAQESLVDETFRKQGKVAQIPGAGVEARDIQKLRPGTWLNDEVINFYLKMIERRSTTAQQKRAEGKEAQERLQKNDYGEDADDARKRDALLVAEVKKRWNGIWNVHPFNSFFYEKLSNQGYASVRQWTRKIDIFTKDLILIPINVGGMHWVCAAINMRLGRLEYYDSMHASNRRVLDVLADYLRNEYADKKKGEFGPLHVEAWPRYTSHQSPAQANGYDCGVFATMTIEQLSRRNPWNGPVPPPLDAKQIVMRSAERAGQGQGGEDSDESEAGGEEEEEEWNFSQRNMDYLRRRMVYEIVSTDLLD